MRWPRITISLPPELMRRVTTDRSIAYGAASTVVREILARHYRLDRDTKQPKRKTPTTSTESKK